MIYLTAFSGFVDNERKGRDYSLLQAGPYTGVVVTMFRVYECQRCVQCVRREGSNVRIIWWTTG